MKGEAKVLVAVHPLPTASPRAVLIKLTGYVGAT